MMEAYTAAPICGSSRYTTASGKYASRSVQDPNYNPNGYSEGMAWVDTTVNKLSCEGQQNIGGAMKDAGYRTGMVGKK